jgi:hypothetical protein
LRANYLIFVNGLNEAKVRHANQASAALMSRLAALNKRKWTVTWWAHCLWILAPATSFAILAVIYEFVSPGDEGPLPLRWAQYDDCLARSRFFAVPIAGICLSVIFIFAYALRKIHDAFAYKRELVGVTLCLLPLFALWLIVLLELVPALHDYTNSYYFLCAGFFVILFGSIGYPLTLSYLLEYRVNRLKRSAGDHGSSDLDSKSDDAGSVLLGVLDEPIWTDDGLTAGPAPIGGDAEDRGQLSHTAVRSAAARVKVATPASAADVANDHGAIASVRGLGRAGLHRVPTGVSNTRLFNIILLNDGLRLAFQCYCMQSWCIENYMFYRDGTSATRGCVRSPTRARN